MMVHAKWFIALILSVAVSVAITNYFTEQYVNERGIAQLSEITILQTGLYSSLVKAINDGKNDEVKAKLIKLWERDVSQIKDYKQRLDSGYFQSVNREDIARIDRYLQAPPAASNTPK